MQNGAANRFYMLYTNIPGIKFNNPEPGIPTFREVTEDFRKLRRAADNLATFSDSIVASDGGALGELNWITGIEIKPEFCAWHCTMRPGTLHKRPSHSIAPFKSTMGWPTDGIRLSLGQHEANLSAVRKHIDIRVKDLENQLENAFYTQNGSQFSVINDFFAKRCVVPED
jgi:hypothetical protein